MGQACAGPTDIDGNGHMDIVVSASGAAAQGQGRVLIYAMDSERLSGFFGSASADHIIDGDPTSPGGFGSSLAALGDHDGDGLDDFAIFGFGPESDNPDPPPNTLDAGTVWIASPGDASFAPTMTFDQLPYSIEGEGNLGFCGHPAGVDVNGDGLGDLVCGDTRPQEAQGLGTAAAVRSFLGGSSLSSERLWSDADLNFEIVDPDSFLGLCVVGLDDRNGDSYAEILIGAPGSDGPLVDSGAVYFVDPSDLPE